MDATNFNLVISDVTNTETVAVTGVKKQDVVIADVTNTSHLTLWEEKVNILIGS